MSEDKISKAFGLEPDEQYLNRDIVPTSNNVPSKINHDNDDYEFVRDNIKELIEKSSNALDHLLDIAKDSESPRAYEVLTQLIRTVTDQNKDLIEIQTKVKGKPESDKNPGNTNIQNAMFIGSTADLLKRLKDGNG